MLMPFVAQDADKVHDSRTRRPPLTRPPVPRRFPAGTAEPMNAQGRGKFRPRRGILTVQVRAPAGGWRAQGGRLVWANPAPHRRLRTGANSLAILLNSRGAQAGEPMPVDGILPSQELFDGQGIAAACLFERQEPAAYG